MEFYRSDNATLYKGEALQILSGLPSNSVDALVTDPPYSSGGKWRGDVLRKPSEKYQMSPTQKSYPEFQGDTRDQRSYALWWTLWGTQCLRVLKEGAPVLVFTDWRQLPGTADALQAAGFVWRGTAVWDKTEGCRPAKGRFRQQSEFVLWGSKGGMPKNEQAGALAGVFRCAPQTGGKFHTTGKPVQLMEKLLEIVQPGATVLDPFAGSGSTGVAALKTGRRFIGVEITHDYCQISAERLAGVDSAAG